MVRPPQRPTLVSDPAASPWLHLQHLMLCISDALLICRVLGSSNPASRPHSFSKTTSTGTSVCAVLRSLSQQVLCASFYHHNAHPTLLPTLVAITHNTGAIMAHGTYSTWAIAATTSKWSPRKVPNLRSITT